MEFLLNSLHTRTDFRNKNFIVIQECLDLTFEKNLSQVPENFLKL